MSKSKWDTSSLRVVIQHLRVPELNYPYELASEASTERRQHSQKLLDASNAVYSSPCETAIELLHAVVADKGSHSAANNLAFLIDRIFDVWLRKNKFAALLHPEFSGFRFLFFKYLLTTYGSILEADEVKQSEQGIESFLSLFDSMGKFSAIWSPNPKRSQSIFLDQLAQFRDAILHAERPNTELISTCLAQWQSFLDKHNDKVLKLNDRLLLSEAKKNKSEYCLWLAHHYINVLFSKRTMPAVLQSFIQEFWVNVVAKEIDSKLPENFSSREAIVLANYHPEFDQLCKNIVRVYCHRSQSGFDLADQLLDQLQSASEHTPLPSAIFTNDVFTAASAFFSKESMWENLSQCLVALLQDQFHEPMKDFEPLIIPDNLTQCYGTSEQFRAENIKFKDLPISLNEWWVFKDDQELQAIQLIGCFEQSQQLLFVNYLGMKAAQFSFAGFQNMIDQQALSKLSFKTSFSNVFDQAVQGLFKIAENQKKAKLAAAAKAKEEAERLLEDRRLAEEQAQQRADEIAQRTQQMLAKRADKQRLEKETAILNTIKAFKLGAWIGLNIEGELQRFKLVVKLAATGKYVFVDRLGVKRREFLEQELLASIQSQQVTVLSDGAEFEDSLQRVVSRLRISK